MRAVNAALLTCIGLAALSACDRGVDLVGPAADNCGAAPFFSVSPVAMADIDNITVFGGLGAPGHTLPTAHAGFYLATEGATVRAPTSMQITKIRRTTYIASPNRQGKQDYATDFQVCKQISGWFGHLATLSEFVPATGGWKECERYSTALETIETCIAKPKGLTVTAGQPLGTSGLSIALGLMSLDFGLMDSRVTNSYVANWRHPDPTRRSICAWDKFEASIQTQLFSKLADKSRPITVPGGNPRCGTMQVDVPGTAKGVWALPTETSPLQGNEISYVTLANYPYRPEDQLALSLGLDALGPGVGVVPRGTGASRVNRPFEQVTNDGLVYCYGPDAQYPGRVWLVQLTGPATLSIKRVTNFVTNTCEDSPATWSMVGAVNMVR